MPSPKVSIIIPVYNVEKYLKECLDSVVNQTLKDIVIICVNDGSTDSSLEILKEYAKNDSRIHIVDKINGGLGAARNSGIKYLIDNNINPKYIYFADSDDWLDIQALEKLYNKSQESNSDICIMSLLLYIEKDKRIESSDYFKTDCYKIRKNDVCDYSEIKNALFGRFGAFLKFYSYEFLINSLWENEEFYPQNLLFEDVYPHIKSLILAKRIAFLDEALYYYRIREGSIMTSSAKSKRTFDIFKSIYMVENFLKNKQLLNELKDNFMEFICELIQGHYFCCPLEYRHEFATEAKAYLAKFDDSFYSLNKIKKQHLKLMLNLNNPYDKRLIKIKNKIIYRFNRLKWSLGVK